MKQTFEDYCREVKAEAECLTQEAEVRACADHLQAFNFGRTVQRLENAPHDFWVRLGWLLIGAAIGAALAAGFVQSLNTGQAWLGLILSNQRCL
jgi:hypothetical protein